MARVLRLLANENCPRALVETLRAAGHEVAWIREDGPGSTDREVLARARRDRRIIVTFDKGFGELAFRSRLPGSCGVLLLRLRAPAPDGLAGRVESVLRSREDWTGVFATVTATEVRIRPIPGS